MFHAIFRTSHWNETRGVSKDQTAQVHEQARDGAPLQMPDAPSPEAQVIDAKKPKVKPTEKAVAAPLIGIGVGFVLTETLPPVGIPLLIGSSLWFLYKNI